MQSEVSAFNTEEEVKKDEQTVLAEELSKVRTETIRKRKELTAKFRPFAIDR